ncbi:MAG: helix-turn-helix domain-containing protein [Candidatus Omnitrophica bacterium]|jgi:predicted DNA-binding transcriptional regulator AlpA|nr:helix-turn-helix domain-containing protein [Candidatus Omnitrophota bacterium]
MKKCSFCAEEIQEEAIKCRFCGEFLDQKSLQESATFKKTNRVNLSRAAVAEYLCVPRTAIDAWVRQEKMPFSRIAEGRVIFRKSEIDRWIGTGDVTAYSRYVSSAKKMSDILPEGYKPPSEEQEWIDYVREVHEKFISKHARKQGISEEEYARGLKKQEVLRTISARAEGVRIKFSWDSKKKKYLITQGEEAYNKCLKNDQGFKSALNQLTILMCILDSWY